MPHEVLLLALWCGGCLSYWQGLILLDGRLDGRQVLLVDGLGLGPAVVWPSSLLLFSVVCLALVISLVSLRSFGRQLIRLGQVHVGGLLIAILWPKVLIFLLFGLASDLVNLLLVRVFGPIRLRLL